jgi:hypothetical protein
MRLKASGGVESIREQAAGRQTLSDDQVHRLVLAGQRIQMEIPRMELIIDPILFGEIPVIHRLRLTIWGNSI